MKVDVVYLVFSLFGFKDVEIVVVEIGWLYKGDLDEVGMIIENVKVYNKNFIVYLKLMVGILLMFGKVIEIYLFVLYDENFKFGKGFE